MVIEVPAWLAALSPIIVAIIAALGVVLARLIRGPVTVQDLWNENRQLRTDLTKVEGQVRGLMRANSTQLTVNRILGEGFDALSGAVERSGLALSFTPAEHTAIDRARALRNDDELWAELQLNTDNDKETEHDPQR